MDIKITRTLLCQERNLNLYSYSLDGVEPTCDIPILLVPSIMLSSNVFNVTNEHSFINFLLENRFKVYCMDFGNPIKADANLRLDDYVLDYLYRSIHMVKRHSAIKQISLVGYCFGGTFAVAFASLSHKAKNDVKNVINIAGPIGNKLKFFDYIFKPFKDRWFAYIKEPGYLSGETIKFLFKLSNPLINIKRLFYTFRFLNREYRKRYKAVANLFHGVKNIPETTFRQCFEILENNTFVDGKLILMDQNVKLSNLESSVLNIAGMKDDFISKESIKTLGEYVVSTDYQYVEFPFGHLSILASKKAKDTVWNTCVGWLKSRSSVVLAEQDLCKVSSAIM